MAVVTIGGLTFSGGATSDSGFFFKGPFDDWFALSDSKSEINERAQSDGAFGVNNDYRKSLPITLNAWALATDRLTAIQMKRQLNAALGTGRPLKMSLDDVDGVTSRVVSVQNAEPTHDQRSGLIRWVIDVIAEDPIAYGESVASVTGVPVAGGGLIFPLGSGAALIDFGSGGSSGQASASNPGTAAVYPDLEVTGGLGLGFVLTDRDTGQSIRFDRQVPLGSTIFINQRTGRAYIDGPSNDVSGFLTSRGFFAIGDGETHQIQFQPLGAVTGSPQLTVRTSPGYR